MPLTVARVGVHPVAAPVAPLVAEGVHAVVVVVDLRVVDVAVHVHVVEDFRVGLVRAEPSHLSK